MTCNLEMKSVTAMQNPFNWSIDSAKNIAKNQKELTIRKRNWINSFNSSLSIPIPFIQFLFNSNSWNWNWNWYQFQFRNWPQPWLCDVITYPWLMPDFGTFVMCSLTNTHSHIDGLVQDCNISSVLAMQFCTKPSIWCHWGHVTHIFVSKLAIVGSACCQTDARLLSEPMLEYH